MQIGLDLRQPVSSTAFGKPFGEISLFRPESSVSTYGQVNKIAEKTDNSLDIEGLLYHDFLCNSTTDSASPSTAQPVTTF